MRHPCNPSPPRLRWGDCWEFQASSDHLEQKILQVLSRAGAPMRTAQLVKECLVPKKQINQVLYRLKQEAKVSLESPATWCLGGSAPGDMVPVDSITQPSQALRPQKNPGTSPESSGPQLSAHHKRICQFLEDTGPCRALRIAKALGKRTAADVNPDLYSLRSRHLLSFDGEKWMTCRPEHPERRYQCAAAPTIMIYQSGANSHISIANSEATQIGHGNVILSQTASREPGPRVPHLCPSASADPSTEGILAGTWGPQDIHMERSMLRHVQLGHHNEMSILSAPADEPVSSFTDSPPGHLSDSPKVSAGAGSSGASFEVRMPPPGPHSEGSSAQSVNIHKCLVEDTVIGNSNRMTINPRSESSAGVTVSREGRRDPGEPDEEDPDPSSEVTRSGSCCPPSSSALS